MRGGRGGAEGQKVHVHGGGGHHTTAPQHHSNSKAVGLLRAFATGPEHPDMALKLVACDPAPSTLSPALNTASQPMLSLAENLDRSLPLPPPTHTGWPHGLPRPHGAMGSRHSLQVSSEPWPWCGPWCVHLVHPEAAWPCGHHTGKKGGEGGQQPCAGIDKA